MIFDVRIETTYKRLKGIEEGVTKNTLLWENREPPLHGTVVLFHFGKIVVDT